MSQDYTDRRERTDADYAIIRKAKRCLMLLGQVDEPTAHHTLRRAAMARRVKLSALAQWLLDDSPRRVGEMLKHGQPARR
jgi:AmiR/NasT family two-component response regulator